MMFCVLRSFGFWDRCPISRVGRCCGPKFGFGKNSVLVPFSKCGVKNEERRILVRIVARGCADVRAGILTGLRMLNGEHGAPAVGLIIFCIANPLWAGLLPIC